MSEKIRRWNEEKGTNLPAFVISIPAWSLILLPCRTTSKR